MKRVLVTGATGFTGRHICHHLSSHGWNVIKTGSRTTKNTDSIPCDISNLSDLTHLITQTRPTYILHLAGLSFTAHEDEHAFADINVEGTENLLRTVNDSQLPIMKIILASSASVYGNQNSEVLDETLLPAPTNAYARSKLAMEHMASQWFDKLPILISRPFNYTGIGQDTKFLVPKIVSHFIKHESSIALGNLDVFRDFSDVRDVCAAYRLLLDSNGHSDIVNICSGRLTSLHDIINTATNITSHHLDIQVNPKFVRQNEITKLRGCNKKLQTYTGHLPFIPIEETLRWMLTSS